MSVCFMYLGNMMFVDFYCYINFKGLVDCLLVVFENMCEYDVIYVLCVLVDLEMLFDVFVIVEVYDNVYVLVGVYFDYEDMCELMFVEFVELVVYLKVVVIGEIGFDYYCFEGCLIVDMEW